MKQLLFFALFLPLSAYGQTFEYDLDMVAKDSFFLVETIYQAPTPEKPRPDKYTSYQLFKSLGELTDFVNKGLEQADKDAVEGERLTRQAADARRRLLQVRALADKKKRP